MNKYWEKTSNRIDAMSLRERVMVFAALLLVLIAILNSLLLDPLLTKQRALSAQMVQQQERSKALQAELETIVNAKNADANSPLRLEANDLRQRLQALNDLLQSRSSRLVEAEKMPDVLRQVLGRNSGLQLVSLQTLPATPLIEELENTDQAMPEQGVVRRALTPEEKQKVYKHGVKLSVRGDYLDLLRYVRSLENLPAQLYWGEAELKLESYPYSVLTLTLYTLSVGETWMVI